MGRSVYSDRVRTGMNAEHTALDDGRYVKCSRCGFICHLDRDMKAPYYSTLGDGVDHSERYIYKTEITPIGRG